MISVFRMTVVRFFLLSFLSLMSMSAHADITTGLLGYYPLNGNATDYSGNNNNGTENNITYGPGTIGQSALFNNTNSYISVPSLAGSLPGGASPRSVAFWMYLNSADNGNMVSWGSMGSNNRFSVLIQGGGRLDVIGQFNDYTSNYTIPQNTWVHVVVTYDGASNLLFYINGVLQATVPVTTPFATDATQPLLMGVNPGLGEPYGGNLEQVRIYNRVLTASDVSELYAYNRSTASVPTLSTFGLLLLVALVMAFGVYQRSRVKFTPPLN